MKKIFLFIIIFCSISFAQSYDTTATNNMDVTLDEHNPTSNFGTDSQIAAMWNSPSVYRMRSIMEWTLPAGTGTITEIALYCYVSGNFGTSVVDLHELTTDFVENQATWNIRKSGTNWTTAGGDYNATVIDETAATAGWQVWYILGGTSNNPLTSLTWGNTVRLLLKQKTESSSSKYNTYYSRDYTTDTTKRPYIKITYVPLSGFVPKVIFIE